MKSRYLIRCAVVALLAVAGPVLAKSPDWLRELASAPLPPQAPEVEAVQLLKEIELVVSADGKMRKRVRGAVRILRREGRDRAVLQVPEDKWHKVQDMHGWTILARDKEDKNDRKKLDPEVRITDVIERSVLASGELISDARFKQLQIPEAEPGATIGYEYEVSQNPLEMADTFGFQDTIPVREASYTLKLPAGWNLLPSWINHPAVESVAAGAQQWRWTLKDIPAVKVEAGMPAWRSVAGYMFLALSPPGKTPQLSTWAGIGSWFMDLSRDRRVASTDIRNKVASLVEGKSSDLEKMRTLASFVQREVRYVGIQLGIGGYQPHAAADVFSNRYGDCKDKATLLGVMLSEVGIESVPVIVNTERSQVRIDMPASMAFNHVILAIRLPRELQDPALLATIDRDGGRWLIFDPTDELTPFGRLRGELQENVGLLALGDRGHLIVLPVLKPEHSGMRTTARLVLNDQGVLTGEIREKMLGQKALLERNFLRSATRASDTTKVVETRLAHSLASFQLSGATPRNRESSELPLEWEYRITASSYARRSGDLLMVRPRVLGVIATTLPGDDKPRVHDLLLTEPVLHQDEFVIELPAGYLVESLPDPVELDVGFAVYRSRSEVSGNRLTYTRSFEVRALTVPVAKIGEFRRINSEIARDERAVVVLKKAGS
jgi:hypothetical protein